MPAAYELPLPGEPIPVQFKLGSICKRDHDWTGKGQSLRYNKPSGVCVLCARQDAVARQERRRLADPEGENAKAAAYKREARADGRMPPRSKYGRPYSPKSDKQIAALNAAIRRAGRLPSVARLVFLEQLQYWRQHPTDRIEFIRQRSLQHHHWRYLTDHSFRLYHRSKSKHRKAKQRGSTALMLTPDQLWRRWVEFGHQCAYCGADGDLHIEHVIPISKGGEHHLGNIVPACQRCNYSKRSAPVEEWYRAQPFFTEERWQTIQAALAKSRPTTEQLAMRLDA